MSKTATFDIDLGDASPLRARLIKVRRWAIKMIAGSDAVILNVNVGIRQGDEAVLHATNGLAMLGGNSSFDMRVKITTNGGRNG